MSEPIVNLRAIFERRYTPTFIRALSCEGNPVLSAIRRDETFAGAHAAHTDRNGERVIQSRARDYERVRFYAEAGMIEACDAAIRALGKRLEANLVDGARTYRDFSGELQTDYYANTIPGRVASAAE